MRACAVEVADADGLPALSMRRVATGLGAGAMSLYTYVPGKAELLDLMLDSVRGEALLPGGAPGGWRARLEWRARADWALYGPRHPWALYVSRARAVLGPHELAVFEETLHAVAGLDLSGREMLAVVSVLEGYVRGAAQGALEAGHAAQRTGLTDDQWWAAREPLLGRYFDPGRFPTVARVQREGGFDRPPGGADYALQNALDDFEFGLQRVLDGVEAFVGRRAARARAGRGGRGGRGG